MGHIHTKTGQHDFTASGFVFFLNSSVPKVFLHRHKILGKYLQFGGHVELNENPWQTVIHELREESGYDIGQLKVLQPKIRIKHLSKVKLHPSPLSIDTHQFSDTHNHIDIKYVFTTNEKPKHLVEGDESKEIKLFSKADFNKLTELDTYKNLMETVNFIFDNVLDGWEAVDTAIFDR